MPPTSSDGSDSVHNQDRSRYIWAAAVTNLTVQVFAPRPQCAVGLEGQGTPFSRSHGYDPAEDLHWIRTIQKSAVSELSIAVTPPRPEAAVGLNRQAVVISGRYSHNLSEELILTLADLNRNPALRGCTVAELTRPVRTPRP